MSSRRRRIVTCLLLLVAVVVGAVGREIVTGVQQAMQPAMMPKKAMPDLGQLYNQAAKYRGVERNPVIVIPGLLGSTLVDQASKRIAWGAFTGESVNPAVAADARLFTVPMEIGRSLSELQDSVAATSVLDTLRVQLPGFQTERHAYLNILRMLGAGGYVDESLALAGAIDYGDDHFTCFQFPYDWRHDNLESVERLHAFILEKQAYLQQEREKKFGPGAKPVKFDIVAHSMGGLVARYFLRYGNQPLNPMGETPTLDWAGAEFVERAILIGTPSGGSAKAVVSLIEGIHPAPVLPHYRPAHLGTMPAIYQLLPRVRHRPVIDTATGEPIDLLNVNQWESRGWGLLDPDEDDGLAQLLPQATDRAERVRIARDHLAKCLERARAFQAALDIAAEPPPGVDLFLFAGDAFPTRSQLGVDPKTGELSVLATAPGDTTVTRANALVDERRGDPKSWSPRLQSPLHFSGVHFLFTDHFGLTEDPAFTDNALHILMEARRSD